MTGVQAKQKNASHLPMPHSGKSGSAQTAQLPILSESFSMEISMLAIPTIDIASGQPPTLASVRIACRNMKLCIAMSYAVLAYFIAKELIVLGQSHMGSTASTLGTGSPLEFFKNLLLVALLLGAAYVLYRSLAVYQSLRLCDDKKICRVIYAVCRANPEADRYRLAVLRCGRGFISAEVDRFFNLCTPELWNQCWPQDLKNRIQSPEPLASITN